MWWNWIISWKFQPSDKHSRFIRVTHQNYALSTLGKYRFVSPLNRIRRKLLHSLGTHTIDFILS